MRNITEELKLNKKLWIQIKTEDPSTDFLNLKDLDFSFFNKGLTIIVGENNVAKTKLLDYIYSKSGKWDGFEDEYINGLYKYMPIFFSLFGENFFVCSPNHRDFVGLERKGQIRCSYEVYYFDLESSIFPLIERRIEKHKTDKEKEAKKEIRFEKGISRSCLTYYTEENKQLWTLKSIIMEDKVMEKTKPIEPVLIEYKDKENFGIDTVTGTRGRNNTLGINHSLDGVGSGLIKCRTLEVLIDKIIEKNKKTRRKQYHYYFNYSLPVSFTPFFSTKGNGESGYNAKRKRRQSKISSLSPKFLTRCYNWEKN